MMVMQDKEFEPIARKLRPVFIAIARRIFANSEEADDVAQDTLLRLWLLRERIDTMSSAEKLGARIARNLCVSLWRKRRNEINSPASEPVNNASPQSLLEEEENARLFDIAVEHLPAAYRRILRLKMDTDMNTRQIAAVTGITPRSVIVMLSTARKQLFDELKHKRRL